jgi:hypothetical protein
MATLSSAARNAAITVPQCISLFQQHLDNIRAGTPDAALRNPVPGGRSIAPNGPTYTQLKRRCEQTGNAEVHRLLADIQGPGQGRGAPPGTPVGMNEMVAEMARVRVADAPAPAPAAAPTPAAAPPAAPERLPGSGILSVPPPRTRATQYYGEDLIRVRTNEAVTYVRSLIPQANTTEALNILDIRMPSAFERFAQDIRSNQTIWLSYAIARVFEIYIRCIRNAFAQRPIIIRLTREYIQPYVNLLPDGDALRDVFAVYCSAQLEDHNHLIRLTTPMNNAILAVLDDETGRFRPIVRAAAVAAQRAAFQPPPGAPRTIIYIHNFINARTSGTVALLRDLSMNADDDTPVEILDTVMPAAFEQFARDIISGEVGNISRLSLAIARLLQTYAAYVRRNFGERPMVIHITREYLRPYIDFLPEGHPLREIFATYCSDELDERTTVIRFPAALENSLREIVDNPNAEPNIRRAAAAPRRARTQTRGNNEVRVQVDSQDSPPPRSPITESPITTDGAAAAEFLGECVVAFGDLPRPFSGVGNKLAKICNKMSNRSQCSLENMSRFLNNLKRQYLNTNLGPEMSGKHIRIANVVRGTELKKLMAHLIVNKSEEDRGIILRRPIMIQNHSVVHSVQFRAQPGANGAIGPGPTRDFFQTAANQLFHPEIGIFKPTSEGSGRMLINPEFNVSRLIQGLANTDENRKAFFKVVGQFLGFLILNNLKYDVHLSNYIQARMLYKDSEISEDEILMYYLLDFPEDRTGRMAMFKRPDDISALGFDFNDEMELDPARGNEALTAANYAEYTRLIARKKLEIAESEPYLSALLDGFFISRKYLRRAGVTVPILDTLMSGREVSPAEMERVIARVRLNSEVWRMPRQRELLQWFTEILSDRGELFPTAVAAEDPQRYAQNADEFKRQLLFWWTSSRYVSDTMNYTINPMGGVGSYFRSHTCSATIDFPPRIASREEMYANLLRQVADTDFNML